jgi:cyclophilin family peptidyl-prolyl cis-trans isomerase
MFSFPVMLAQFSGGNSAVLLEPQADITAIVEMTTTKGTITIGLYGKDAPMTVGNFLGLIKEKFYDSIIFHRIVKDFVIQAGDDKTKNPKLQAAWGTGGKSYYGAPFKDELNADAPSYQTGYVRGVMAMANSGPATNTSQFFICLTNLSLPKNYTIFGKVMSGLNVVDAIAASQQTTANSADHIRILSISIKKEQE